MVAALGFAWGRRPSVATRCRPFRDGAGAAFEPALAAWLRVEAPPGEALAIDGKTLRSSHGEAMPGRQLLAAYAHGRAAVRGPRDLRQPVVTGAAPCCQRDLCTPILAQGGDDLFVGQGLPVLPHHQRDAGSGRARRHRGERRRHALQQKHPGHDVDAMAAVDAWAALLSTDATVQAALRHYRLRWAIEGSYRDAQRGWDGRHGWDLEPTLAQQTSATVVERIAGLWALGLLVQSWEGDQTGQPTAPAGVQQVVRSWTVHGRLSVFV